MFSLSADKVTYLSNFAILFWILIILLDRPHMKENLISRRLVRQRGQIKFLRKRKVRFVHVSCILPEIRIELKSLRYTGIMS